MSEQDKSKCMGPQLLQLFMVPPVLRSGEVAVQHAQGNAALPAQVHLAHLLPYVAELACLEDIVTLMRMVAYIIGATITAETS